MSDLSLHLLVRISFFQSSLSKHTCKYTEKTLSFAGYIKWQICSRTLLTKEVENETTAQQRFNVFLSAEIFLTRRSSL